MKKYLSGLFAILLAIGFSAFTIPKSEKSRPYTNYYYFNAGVTTQAQSSVPFTDPESEKSAACSGADNVACKDGWTAVTVSGANYVASGTLESPIKKP